MSDETKNETDQTVDQDVSTDETKDESKVEDTTQKDESSKEQEFTKEEIEMFQKKAKDFDGIIEKKRLEKLAKRDKKDETTVDVDDEKKVDLSDIKDEVKGMVAEMLRESTVTMANQNLTSAYKKFISENKWADDEVVIDAISDKLNLDNAVTEEDILVKLNITAQQSFPDRYEKAKEAVIRARILAEQGNINAGGGGDTSEKKNVTDGDIENASKEDQRIANRFFDGNIERYLKTKK